MFISDDLLRELQGAARLVSPLRVPNQPKFGKFKSSVVIEAIPETEEDVHIFFCSFLDDGTQISERLL